MLGAAASGAIELEPSIFGPLCEYADILHRCQLAIKTGKGVERNEKEG
jgi:hypothetical protein